VDAAITLTMFQTRLLEPARGLPFVQNGHQHPKTEKTPGRADPAGRLWTFQDLGILFGVHWKTVSRWFRGRKIFRPTHTTARVTQAQLDAFFLESNRQPITTPGLKPGKKKK
jgi:hypothetical protein